MLQLLAIFQFIFLFIPTLFIGMAVYGTEIKSASGISYIATLVFISLILYILKKHQYPDIFIRLNKHIAIIGGILALLLYQKLHFNFWDEHSLTQALLVLGIGVTSCLSSINSALCLEKNKVHTYRLFNTLALISFVWVLSIYYPMISFFIIALILLISPLFSSTKNRHFIYTPANFSRYFIFLIFLDLPLVIWDFKVNTEWGIYISISLLSCAFGLALPINRMLLKLSIILFIANFIYCIIYPQYILNPLHNLFTGLTLGIYINSRLKEINIDFTLIPALAAPAVLGFIFSLLFYSNLDISIWRIAFLLVIPVYFLKIKFRNSIGI